MQDNVAVINAPDLTPVIKHAGVKEIREIVQVTAGMESSTPVSVSIKVAELPTTTPIEVS